MARVKKSHPSEWTMYVELGQSRDIADLIRHCNYVKVCLSHQKVPTAWPYLIDHRFFYSEFVPNDVGNYTCGFIRNVVVSELRMNGADFADTDFLTSSPDYIDNPCVTGFMIEQAILSSIVSNGLAIGESIGRPMMLVMFNDEFPKFRTDVADQPVLYCR